MDAILLKSKISLILIQSHLGCVCTGSEKVGEGEKLYTVQQCTWLHWQQPEDGITAFLRIKRPESETSQFTFLTQVHQIGISDITDISVTCCISPQKLDRAFWFIPLDFIVAA